MKSLPNLSCGDCSRCCTTPRNEKNRTPMFKSDYSKGYNTPEYEFNAHKDCYSCNYLGEDGLCHAYEKRPLVCRLYPLYPIKLGDHYKLAVATYKCHVGQTILSEVTLGNKDLIEEIKEICDTIDEDIRYSELNRFTEGILLNYNTISILNI